MGTTWLYNPLTNEWTSGPPMKEKRKYHSCFYDIETNSVFVAGGVGKEFGVETDLETTERLNLDNNVWESTPSLPGPLAYSAGVESKSREYVGFVAGGSMFSIVEDKVWGLRRKDLNWEELPQQLKTMRWDHSMVNLAADKVPGC